MTSKSDGPGKGPAKPAAEGGAPKKPAAILELKATSVEDKDPGPAKSSDDPKAPTAEKKAESKPAESSSGSSGPTGAHPAETPKPAGAASPQTTTDATASKEKVAGKPEDSDRSSSETASEKRSPKPTGGIRSFFTHTAAGIAGGFLALLGADTIGPRLGLTKDREATHTSELRRRLDAVEQTDQERAASAADILQKLAAAEGRLAQLEDLSKSVSQLRDAHTQLGEAHAKLAGETQQLEQKLSEPDAAAQLGARLAKLEEILAALSSAAASDPQSGRIPQLAAITGKLNDLEATLNNQLTALRESLRQEIDARVAQIAEASETAKAGTQRIDRELAAVKEDTSRLAQNVESLNAAGSRLDQTLRSAREDTAGLVAALDALKRNIAAELDNVVRPPDVSTAIAPIASKVAALDENLQGVVKSEDDRKAHAERIVLALELGNLKRALDRGGAYAAELAELNKLAGGKVDLAALERSKDEGVPTAAELTREFRAVAHAVIDAEADPVGGSVVDRLLHGAKSIVRVRRTDHGADDNSAEAVIGRMEKALRDDKYADVLAEAQRLSPKARAAAAPWLGKLEARAAVDRAIAGIENHLKASLAGTTQPEKRTQ
jgi:hypothetical protein